MNKDQFCEKVLNIIFALIGDPDVKVKFFSLESL